MPFDKKEDKKSNVPESFVEWLVFLLPFIITLLGVIFAGCVDVQIQQMKEKHDIHMYQIKNTKIQHFYSEMTSVKKFGIDFMNYKIESKPAVKGFHVIAFPYILCENKEKKIISLRGQFMQDEYVADGKGCCTLLREDTTDNLIQMVENLMDFSVDVKCLVALKYMKNDEEQIEVFDLKDGQLIKSSEDTVISVLEAWQKKGRVKLDMKQWLNYDETDLKDIFS